MHDDLPAGDLGALADAIAALLDAPVTIEDRDSRVLAFSGRQDEADASRVATVLGQRVPERYTRVLAERGVFRDLDVSREPIAVDPVAVGDGEVSLPRVAVAVRAGDEVLGSIWAAVPEPLSAERLRALADAAPLVAVHLLRNRSGADAQRRHTGLVRAALAGGAAAGEALHALGLAGRPVAILALAPCGTADEVEVQRLAGALTLHLSTAHPRSATALLGDTTYGLIPVPATDDAVRIAGAFLDRVGGRGRPVAAVAPPETGPAALAAARTGADRALRVLRADTGRRRVATLADVQAEALLLDLRDLAAARGDRPAGPVARLAAYDAGHRTCLLPTLGAWLDAFGDVADAAAALHVHPNTFRYRLRRVAEIGGLDLSDPDDRFAVMLQLRVLPPPG